jgi:SAM-dependent methyltransferase
LEIGTGWYPVVPLSLIAAGVERVYSVDIVWLCTREQLERTLDLFLQEPHLDAAVRARFATVRNQLNRQPLHQSLEDLGIHYLIGDARRLDLPADSVDLIHSNNTFEHIPEPILEGILSEFERVLRPGGVQTHFVDLTDHFAHFDRSITPYHFLQFSDRAWRWIDNGIQPMNRMRQSDYLRMYERVGIRPVEHTWEPGDLQALAQVRRSKRFAAYSAEDAAITHCRITSTKVPHNPAEL